MLNGNGTAGAAASAAGQLETWGYHVLAPPRGAPANAPSSDYRETEIYDPAVARAAAAADTLAKLISPAEVQPLPADPALLALDPHAMLLVVVGESFLGRLTLPSVLRQETATVATGSTAAQVEAADGAGTSLLAPLAHRVPFQLETPTLLGADSQPDDIDGDESVRLYPITPHTEAIRLVFVTGGNQYWGIEETNWSAAPILGDDNVQRTLKARTYGLYYANGHLEMVVLHADGATYWVVNTLLNDLSNATMIAIAEGLKPLGRTPVN